jgi:hypothetical protein
MQQEVFSYPENTHIIKDAQSALDLIATVQYETDCDKFIVNKSCVVHDFLYFKHRTCRRNTAKVC